MPDKNGTGPIGKGPMTGHGSGKCIIPLNTKNEELNFLKDQEKTLTAELTRIKARMAALEEPQQKGV
jgi:hypothetical protein